jgi:hypothetical protein
MSNNRRGRSLAEVMPPLEDESPSPSRLPATAADSQLVPEAITRASRGGEVYSQVVVPINVLVTPEDRRRLKQLSLDSNLSLQKLGHEAWNLLLQKRGLPSLKPVSANVPSGRPSGRSRH